MSRFSRKAVRLGIKIAYIDDEAEMCLIFADNFSTSDIDILTFSDLTNIVEKVEGANPDLIFLDYRLPNTNGDTLAGVLSPSVPKVLITGDMAVQPKANFLRVFSKPFDFCEMEDFIAEFSKNKQ